MRLIHASLAVAALAAPIASADATRFYASSSGDVVAYFAGTGAAYTETLGLMINGVATGITGLNNHSSYYGQSLVLGNANIGDELTFFIDVADTGYRYFSNVALNPDGVEHITFSTYAGSASLPAGTYVGFEDLFNGGDYSYQDLMFVFTNVTDEAPSVPEPLTWAMMVIGFGAAGTAIRRHRQPIVTFGCQL